MAGTAFAVAMATGRSVTAATLVRILNATPATEGFALPVHRGLT